MVHPDGDDYTETTDVYFMSWPWSGSGRMFAATENYYTYDPINNPGGSRCTGRYVALADPGWNYLGRLTYVHLTNQPSVGDYWFTAVGTWTFRYMGRPATSQETGCEFYGPHLHEGEKLEDNNQITYNTALLYPYGTIDPTNDAANNWMFSLTLIDSDGDGCADSEEIAQPNNGLSPLLPGETGGFDPHAWYDFYDVPVPSLRSGPGGVYNQAINMGDVLAVLDYVGAKVGDAAYEADNDGNGMRDGLQYDRSPSALPNPPGTLARRTGQSAWPTCSVPTLSFFWTAASRRSHSSSPPVASRLWPPSAASPGQP